MKVGRAECAGAQWPGTGGVIGVKAAGRGGSAEDSAFVLVACGPFGGGGYFGDLPMGDQAFSDAGVLADRWKVGEEIADGIGFSDGAPGEVGGWVCHDRDDAVLIASGLVGDGF